MKENICVPHLRETSVREKTKLHDTTEKKFVKDQTIVIQCESELDAIVGSLSNFVPFCFHIPSFTSKSNQ